MPTNIFAADYMDELIELCVEEAHSRLPPDRTYCRSGSPSSAARTFTPLAVHFHPALYGVLSDKPSPSVVMSCEMAHSTSLVSI
jgi:hypothetical protein